MHDTTIINFTRVPVCLSATPTPPLPSSHHPFHFNVQRFSTPFYVQGLGLEEPDPAAVAAIAAAVQVASAEEEAVAARAQAFAIAASSGADVGGDDLMLDRRRGSVGFAIVPPAGAAVFGAFRSVLGGIGSVAGAVGGGIGNVAGAVGGGIAAGGRGVVSGVSTAGRGLFNAVATSDANVVKGSSGGGGGGGRDGGGDGGGGGAASAASAAALAMTEEERDLLMQQLARADALLAEEQAELKTQEAEIYAAKFLEAVEVENKLKRMEEVLKEEKEELEWQERVMAIDKKENEQNPDEGAGGPRASMSTGNDAFSEAMRKEGLKHLKGGGEEVRLTHTMLPPELDLMASFAGDAAADADNDEQGIEVPAAATSAGAEAGVGAGAGAGAGADGGNANGIGEVQPAEESGGKAAAPATSSDA